MKVRVGDIAIACGEHGDGPPVVLLHGLAEDHRSWDPVRHEIEGYRTIACDLRGHGETGLGEAAGTLSQLAGDLTGFLEAHTGPARCVGYSLGGTIVLAAAAARPDLVTQAVVSGTSTVVGRAAAAFFTQRAALLERDRDAFAKALGEDTSAQVVTDGVDLDQLAARRLVAVGDGGGYLNAARAMIAMHDAPLTPALADVRCPVDVIGGDRDVFCPRKAADIILDALPGAVYQELRDCGHLMSVDQPSHYAAAIVRALGSRRG